MKNIILCLFLLGVICFICCKKTNESLADVPNAVVADSKEMAHRSIQEMDKNKQKLIDKTKAILVPSVQKLEETLPKLKNEEASKKLKEYALLVSELFSTTKDTIENSTEIQLQMIKKLKDLLVVMQRMERGEKQKITDWLNQLPELTGSTQFH